MDVARRTSHHPRKQTAAHVACLAFFSPGLSSLCRTSPELWRAQPAAHQPRSNGSANTFELLEKPHSSYRNTSRDWNIHWENIHWDHVKGIKQKYITWWCKWYIYIIYVYTKAPGHKCTNCIHHASYQLWNASLVTVSWLECYPSPEMNTYTLTHQTWKWMA